MVDGDDGEEFPPKLTELLFYGYRLPNADVYPLSDASDIYRLSDTCAIKWSMHCLVNMCEQDISIDFCRVRGPHALMHSPPHTNIMHLSANDRRCANNIRKSFELTFHFSKPVCPY